MAAPRILVIGVGSIGERHVRCLQRTGGCTVGICEPGDAVRQQVAERYQPDGVFADVDEALRASWDSAVIATPAPLHIPLARQAVAAGVSALIEKPLALADDGIEALLDEARAAALPLGVAYVYRAHPMLLAMREAIASGRFGEPLQVSVVSGQNFPFYRPAYARTYYAKHETGGGSIQDALTHLFNAVQWLVGPCTRLSALTRHHVLETTEVEDTVSMIAEHGNVLVTYSQNQHQAANETTIQVVCRSGTCRFEIHRHAWSWVTGCETPWQEQTAGFAERDDWFTQQEQAWLDTIAGRRDPLCSVPEGRHTLATCRAALASAADGGAWQTLPTPVGM